MGYADFRQNLLTIAEPTAPIVVDRAVSLSARARRVSSLASRHADIVDRDGRFPAEAVMAIKAERLLGMMIPVEFGGEGASLADAALVCGILAQGCAAAAMVFAGHQIGVSMLIGLGMESPWHRALMRRIATEQLLVATAMSETGIGEGFHRAGAFIQTDGGLFNLGKDAVALNCAGQADAVITTARRNAEASQADQFMAVLLAGQFGLRKAGQQDAMGLRGVAAASYRLDARAALEQVTPRPFDEAAANAMSAATHLLWAGVWQGTAGAALVRAQACIRAQARQRPDRAASRARRLADAVLSFRTMQSALATVLRRAEIAHAQPGGWLSPDLGNAVAAIRVEGPRACVAICRAAMEVCGSDGYGNDTAFSVGRHLRDALAAPVMAGDEDALEDLAGQLMSARLDITLTI